MSILSLMPLIVTASGAYFAEAPKGEVLNSVGAGDSSVAGFLYGFVKYRDFEKALAFAVACGSATAFSEGIGTNEQVDALLPRIRVCKK